MKIINIVLLIIIVLEFLIFLFYLKNIKGNKENKVLIIPCIIILLFSIIIGYIKNDILQLLSINNYVVISSAILSAIILKFIYYNVDLQNKYNKLIKLTMEYEKIIDDQGKKNHEYKNQLLVLKGYIDNKQKLKEYLDEIIDDNKLGQNFEIRQLANISNGGLKELLYYKISKIKENNIKYYLYISDEISKPLEKLSINKYKNITKVFGVLIDNAIDSAINSKEKEIYLDFSKDSKYIVITISNSYNKKIDLNKIGKKGFTSKGKGHGFGLRLAKEIIKKNNYLELSTDYNDKHFIQTFLIEIK